MGKADIDVKTNLGPILADLKEIGPKLARDVRRDIRAAGSVIIDESGTLLDSETGGRVLRTEYRKRSGQRRGGYRSGPLVSEVGGQVIDRVVSAPGLSGGSTGARAEVKSGMKTRVSVTKARGASVRVQTTKGVLRKALNKKKWRHPIFGNEGSWVEQAGTEYFKRGVIAGGREAREQLTATVKEAASLVKNHPVS